MYVILYVRKRKYCLWMEFICSSATITNNNNKCTGRKVILPPTRDLGTYYKCAILVLILIGALAIINWYIEDELPTLVRGLQCSGSESSVLNCSMNNDGSCPTSSDASVICPGTYVFNYTYFTDWIHNYCNFSSNFYLLQLHGWWCEIGEWLEPSWRKGGDLHQPCLGHYMW